MPVSLVDPGKNPYVSTEKLQINTVIIKKMSITVLE